MRPATVLIVDDDPHVRRLAAAILRAEGLNVCTADNGVDALDIARRLECRLNLLLTDMVMPELDGHDLILAIRRVCPYISTLLMTGALMADDARLKTYKILRKPFTRAQLIAAVQETLDNQII